MYIKVLLYYSHFVSYYRQQGKTAHPYAQTSYTERCSWYYFCSFQISTIADIPENMNIFFFFLTIEPNRYNCKISYAYHILDQ